MKKYILIHDSSLNNREDIAEMIHDYLDDVGYSSCMDSIHDSIIEYLSYCFGVPFFHFVSDVHKDTPNEGLFNQTPSKVLSAFRNEFTNAVFSRDVWANRLKTYNLISTSDFIIVSDVQIDEELEAFGEEAHCILYIQTEEKSDLLGTYDIYNPKMILVKDKELTPNYIKTTLIDQILRDGEI